VYGRTIGFGGNESVLGAEETLDGQASVDQGTATVPTGVDGKSRRVIGDESDTLPLAGGCPRSAELFEQDIDTESDGHGEECGRDLAT
jgi:hypothetical protein